VYDIFGTLRRIISFFLWCGFPAGGAAPVADPPSDIDSLMSFDIHNTMLEVESVDREAEPGLGGGFSGSGVSGGLALPPAIGRQRRWSIHSSDTSSFRRPADMKPKKHSKESR